MTGEWKEKLLRFINEGEPFVRHNHIRVVDIDDGLAVVELTLHPESMNRWNRPHGGALFTLGDIAAGVATLTLRGESCVTLNSSIDFIASAAPAGKLTATGRIRQSGGKVSFCDIEIRDEGGELIARMSAVMYFTGYQLDL